jgi:hypothetical protein
MGLFKECRRSQGIARARPVAFWMALSLAAALAPRATAATVAINVGVFSFDVLIPGGPQAPGLDQFTVDNLTGPNSLPSDFPLADEIAFRNPVVTLGAQTFHLPDIGAGSVQPPDLTFLDSAQFSTAEFQGTIVGTQFKLADGSFLDLTSNVVSGTILPSQSANLAAGVDSVLLTVTGTISMNSAPEPPNWALLLVTGLIVVLVGVFRNWPQKRVDSL